MLGKLEELAAAGQRPEIGKGAAQTGIPVDFARPLVTTVVRLPRLFLAARIQPGEGGSQGQRQRATHAVLPRLQQLPQP
ncbi:MAG: hypothetical protein AW07_04776 [Candidatus Accumulibacter sp. SK-11]|nr:MAG: hypothetical protein AW07_04776 [Candidatus Accumulibacter sp. SK-11]